MTTLPHDLNALADLRARLTGDTHVPGDEGYDLARTGFNLAVDQRPALVAAPRDAREVAEVVRYARRRGLRVAPQSTGHNPGPLRSLANSVLLKTGAMRGVQVDAGARRARVEGGAQWLDVTAPASEAGLAALSGSSPDVGVAGYSLGGGVSWLARKYGLASNSVTAIELVTADGELVRTDAGHEPDLFWALRGGGGNFGVVTALEFELEAHPQVYAGALLWPSERGADVLHRWREWTAEAPEEATTAGRFLNFPPAPELPEHLRGRSFVVIDGAVLLDEDAAVELLRPLRELGPEIDTWATVAPVALSRIHMDPEDPVPAISTTGMLRELPAAAVDALVEAAGPESGTALIMAELRHVGGATARAPEGHGALATLDGEYAMYSVGIAAPPVREATQRSLDVVSEALAPWNVARPYLNFAETHGTDVASLFDEVTLRRLRAVKAQVDPLNVIQANHEIAPAQ